MKSYLLIVFLSALLFGACVDDDPACSSPYALVDGACCLDSNANKICDRDETLNAKPVPSVDQTTTTSYPGCPFECCSNLEGYSDLVCQGNLVCVNNTCEKQACPYKCCPEEGDYRVKGCSRYYGCVANSCVALDTDGDRLLDHEEAAYGTDLGLGDSDGDGLDDYSEVMVEKTDPLNPNTDGDRYVDSEDPEPLKVNSANMSVLQVSSSQKANSAVLMLGKAYCSARGCNSTGISTMFGEDEWAYNHTWTYEFTNIGDDYTPYYKADFSVYYGTDKGSAEKNRLDYNLSQWRWERIKSETVSFEEIAVNETKTKLFTYVIYFKDLPEEHLEELMGGEIAFLDVVENEQYEKIELSAA